VNPSRLFIERPVATTLLMLALLFAGLLGLRALPVSALPEVDYPTIQVSTLYPGAGPDLMASAVTAPLERRLGQMPGLAQMSSTSSAGASTITLRFALSLSLDVAAQQVQAALNAASNLLPADLPAPPVYSKINPADSAVLTLAVNSPTLPLSRVHDLVESRLAPKLAQLSGVGLVSIAGGRRPAVRVQADPGLLARLQLSLEDLRIAIVGANVNQAKGGFDGPERASTIDANDQLKTATEYARLTVAMRDGQPVRLADVARVIDDAENQRLAAWADNAEAVVVTIQRQPGANVVQTVERVKALLPELQKAIPEALDVRVLADRTVTIRASVHDVAVELVYAVALVVLVVLAFLHKASATVIPAVAVPLSLLGTCCVMHLAGFSINNLTLMALTIATGFVVDDAIVMVENIARHIEGGASPRQAALDGSQQIGFTIISLTLSLVAVLIPLLFMGGVVGRLFHEFAITLAVAILISAAVSLTLTPMMCARMLGATHAVQEGRFARLSNRIVDGLVAAYGRSLRWALAHPAAMLTVFGATLVATAWLAIAVPKGLFPQQDTGVLQLITEAPGAVSHAAMAERQQRAAAVILRDPAVQGLVSFVGVDGTNPSPNVGRMLVTLKPLAERGPLAAVLQRLRSPSNGVPGLSLHWQALQDLTLDERTSKNAIPVTLGAPRQGLLDEAVPRLVQALRAHPQFADVGSDQQADGQQAWLQIDRDAAGRLGVTMAAIDNALYTAFGQRQISTVFTQTNQYRVVLEVAPEHRVGPEALARLYVPGAGGVQVPLAAVASVTQRRVPLAVSRLGQLPANTVSFNLAPAVALGDGLATLRQVASDAQLPAAVELAYQGAAAAFQASSWPLLALVAAAVFTMYVVLGVLYESFVHPVTILSTLPSAALGALLALLLLGLELDVIAIIGIVLLIGIVKKNAIMMIDFALTAKRERGLGAEEAIFEAACVRLRPILMTTLAALLGALPLMLGSGVGSELRHPLGVAMVGGLLLSQLLTLYSTPVIYLSFDTLGQRWRQRRCSSATAVTSRDELAP